jgi:drug/metabolite transporter (DMT)-like permease
MHRLAPARPAATPFPDRNSAREQRRGLWLGLLGVALFALTLPMTRLAVGDAAAPQLPPAFVTAGRAALAGLCSLLVLGLSRAPRPPRSLLPALAVCALGTVVGFPLGIALALREAPAMHAAVITGVLPLATAAVAAVALRQRPSLGFWACAIAGTALVVGFALLEGGGRLSAADGWLLLAVLSAAVGYVAGTQATLQLGAERAICWVLAGSLPLTLPAALWWWPAQGGIVALSAWGGFVYVGLVSMWLGFFAWYRALAIGGVMRISQLQLVQPFLSLLLAVPLLGERLQVTTLAFALAVVAVVFIGRKMPVQRTRAAPARR